MDKSNAMGKEEEEEEEEEKSTREDSTSPSSIFEDNAGSFISKIKTAA